MAKFTDEEVQRIAALAVADARTVLRAIAGLPVRGRVRERIKRALEEVRRAKSESGREAGRATS